MSEIEISEAFVEVVCPTLTTTWLCLEELLDKHIIKQMSWAPTSAVGYMKICIWCKNEIDANYARAVMTSGMMHV